MSQILIANCCNAVNFDYIVTYNNTDREKTYQICNLCWNKSHPFEFDETTTKNIKIFQIKISKIICKNCNSDVTKTLGCQICHPESFPNSKEVAP